MPLPNRLRSCHWTDKSYSSAAIHNSYLCSSLVVEHPVGLLQVRPDLLQSEVTRFGNLSRSTTLSIKHSRSVQNCKSPISEEGTRSDQPPVHLLATTTYFLFQILPYQPLKIQKQQIQEHGGKSPNTSIRRSITTLPFQGIITTCRKKVSLFLSHFH